MVKVRYSEGVAIHTDPESCAGHSCEAVREALTGGAYRRGIDRRKQFSPG
jgi:hypothetical protein